MNDFKKKMKEKIKQYSNQRYLNGYVKKEFLTDDGDADIFLNIEDKYDVLDSWTIGNQIDLEKEIYEYIDDKTSMLGNHVPINLHFMGYEFTSKEQGIIKHILKEHYAIELYEVQQKYNELKAKIFGLVLIGIGSFILYSYLFFEDNMNYLVEIFGFLFSFALWEAMDAFIYSFSDVKSEREAVTQNLLMNVDFDYDPKKVKEKDI